MGGTSTTLSHQAKWSSLTTYKRKSLVRFRPAHFDTTGQILYALSTRQALQPPSPPKKNKKKRGWGLPTLSHLAKWSSLTACKRKSPVRFRPAHFDTTGQILYALSTRQALQT